MTLLSNLIENDYHFQLSYSIHIVECQVIAYSKVARYLMMIYYMANLYNFVMIDKRTGQMIYYIY